MARRIIDLIISLIIEKGSEEDNNKLLNMVRNVSGSLSPPSYIIISPDSGVYESWMPVVVYHTCFNRMDVRVNLLKEKSESELREELSNYLFGDFSKNMGMI